MSQTHFIALVHKDPDSSYGVSFPDVPGVTTVADTLDDAISEAAVALGFAFKDWPGPLPVPRTLEELRGDKEFLEDSADAIIIAVRPNDPVFEAAQEPVCPCRHTLNQPA